MSEMSAGTRTIEGERPKRQRSRVVGSESAIAAPIHSLGAAGNMAIQRRLGGVGIQRACSCGDCPACIAKRQAGPLPLQRKAKEHGGVRESGAPPDIHEVLRSPGTPLDGPTRASMEPHFGQDLSGVRIHTDSQAAHSARSIQALAYTVGKDVVFGSGQFSPQTDAGRGLLAHELTHVVQQGATNGSSAPQHRLEIGSPDDVYEQEAERMAASVTGHSGQALHTDPSTSRSRHPVIQRACGPTGIGVPKGVTPAGPEFVSGDIFRFLVNCDDFVPDAEPSILMFAEMIPEGSTVEIHGYASVDGPEAFNANLSAARSLVARDFLVEGGIAASRITGMFGHGATKGPVNDRRSVVVVVKQAAAPVQKPEDTPPKPDNKTENKTDNKTDPDKKVTPVPPTPTTPEKEAPEQHQRLTVQIPFSPISVQIPLTSSNDPRTNRNTSWDQAAQPNVAIGLNYNFDDAETGWQLGLFVQSGPNYSLKLNDAPLTYRGTHSYHTGWNRQAYLQPSYVFLSIGDHQLAVLGQVGVGQTFDSMIPYTDGTSVSAQLGVQWTYDIIHNKLQLTGSLMLGASKTDLNEAPPGGSRWQDTQPFVGITIGIQPVITLLKYPKHKP